MHDKELAPFIAAWQRDGLSEEQIAKRIERHIRLAAADDDDGEPWHVERVEEPDATDEIDPNEDLDQLAEDDASDGAPVQPVGPELQAAISGGLQIMADPGNEPKQTREPPRRIKPRAGREPLDVTSPEAKRMLEKLRPRSLAEIAGQKPPQWLIARHVPEKQIMALFGRFGTCKSFLAFDWSLSIATGTAWLGRRVQQGHVVYISAEGSYGITKRTLAWCQVHDVEEPPTTLHAITCSVDMTKPEILDYLALAIKLELKDAKPKLIVIDTLNRCFRGDENSNKEMGDFVAGCEALIEEFDATVLVLHHTGHDASRGSRGATAFPCAVDMAFLLTKEEGSPIAILKNGYPAKHHKDSAQLPDQALEFVEVEIAGMEPNEDDPNATTSLVVRAANAEAAAAAEREHGAKKKMTSASEETLVMIRGCSDGITISSLAKLLHKPPQTIRSRVKNLQAAGRIRQEGELLFANNEDNRVEMSMEDEVEAAMASQTQL